MSAKSTGDKEAQSQRMDLDTSPKTVYEEDPECDLNEFTLTEIRSDVSKIKKKPTEPLVLVISTAVFF